MPCVFITTLEMFINIAYFQYHGLLNMIEMAMQCLIHFYTYFSHKTLLYIHPSTPHANSSLFVIVTAAKCHLS